MKSDIKADYLATYKWVQIYKIAHLNYEYAAYINGLFTETITLKELLGEIDRWWDGRKPTKN